MEQEIERAIRTTLVVLNKQSIDISVKKIMDVINRECEHPWAFIIGDGEMSPAKCLKCGKYISE